MLTFTPKRLSPYSPRSPVWRHVMIAYSWCTPPRTQHAVTSHTHGTSPSLCLLRAPCRPCLLCCRRPPRHRLVLLLRPQCWAKPRLLGDAGAPRLAVRDLRSGRERRQQRQAGAKRTVTRRTMLKQRMSAARSRSLRIKNRAVATTTMTTRRSVRRSRHHRESAGTVRRSCQVH